MEHDRMTRGQRTRQRIVESAAKVFNRYGYAGTPISELMRATGLCKGGIYRHFNNKEELAVEAFRYAWSKARIPRCIEAADCPSATDQLKRAVAGFVGPAPPEIPGGCPLMNTAVDADDSNPHLIAAARTALHEWREILENIVREGQRKGEICGGASPYGVAAIVIGSLEGALLISRIEHNRAALAVAKEHLDAYIDALAPPRKRASAVTGLHEKGRLRSDRGNNGGEHPRKDRCKSRGRTGVAGRFDNGVNDRRKSPRAKAMGLRGDN